MQRYLSFLESPKVEWPSSHQLFLLLSFTFSIISNSISKAAVTAVAAVVSPTYVNCLLRLGVAMLNSVESGMNFFVLVDNNRSPVLLWGDNMTQFKQR